jgi:hypothetical protein
MLDKHLEALFSPLRSPIGDSRYKFEYLLLQSHMDLNQVVHDQVFIDIFAHSALWHECAHWLQHIATAFGFFMNLSSHDRSYSAINLFGEIRGAAPGLFGIYGENRASVISTAKSAKYMSKHGVALDEFCEIWRNNLLAERTFMFPSNVLKIDPGIPIFHAYPYVLQGRCQRHFGQLIDDQTRKNRIKDYLDFLVKSERPHMTSFEGEIISSVDLLESWACCLELISLLRVHEIAFDARLESVIRSSYGRVFRFYFYILNKPLDAAGLKKHLIDLVLFIEAALNPPLPPLLNFFKDHLTWQLYPPRRFSYLIRTYATSAPFCSIDLRDGDLRRISEKYTQLIKDIELETVLATDFLHLTPLHQDAPEKRTLVQWTTGFSRKVARYMKENGIASVTHLFLSPNASTHFPPLISFQKDLLLANGELLPDDANVGQWIAEVFQCNSIVDLMLGRGPVSYPKLVWPGEKADLPNMIHDAVHGYHREFFPYLSEEP